MKKLALSIIILSIILMSFNQGSAAPASEQLYYTKTTNLSNGSHLLRFSLWTLGSGGTEVSNMPWWEVKTINLTSGTVTTYLGSVTASASRSGLLGDVDFSQQYWVQIDEVSGTAPNYIYTPVGTRTKLNMVPYAMHSITSENAASGGSVPSVTAGSGLTSTTFVDGDVTLNVGAGAGISVGADTVGIKTGGVTTSMLAAGAVTDAKIRGPISIANGGTGSSTKEFVDLSTDQTVSGAKTFSNPIVSGVSNGIAPFQVASATMVTNLNADMVGGKRPGDIITAASDEKRTAITYLPYTISSSGSYYLTGNLTSLGMGITVNADNVTIDLGGFTITGPGASNSGIWMNGRINVEIKNGMVKNFSTGIAEISTSGRGHRVINVRAITNGNGIKLDSTGNIVNQCTSINNTGYGIYAGANSSITGNTVSYNGYDGINAGVGSTIFLNTVANNTWNGITAGTASTVSANTVTNSGHNGIYPGMGSTITGNSVYYSQWTGIFLSGSCLADRNTAYSNKLVGGSYVNMTPYASCTSCAYGLNVAP